MGLIKFRCIILFSEEGISRFSSIRFGIRMAADVAKVPSSLRSTA